MSRNDLKEVTAHLANEQAFLAWLRTGVEVMALGFVAIRSSLFASQVAGIILVGAVAVMTILAYFRHRATLRQLRDGRYKYSSRLLTITAIAIFGISMILLFYLVEAYFNDQGAEKPKTEKVNVPPHQSFKEFPTQSRL